MRREAKVLRAAATSTGLYSGNRIDSTNCISLDSATNGTSSYLPRTRDRTSRLTETFIGPWRWRRTKPLSVALPLFARQAAASTATIP